VKRTAGALSAFVVLFLLGSGPHAAQATPPKLVVLLIVDQMRADYVDRFSREWTGGLKRLVAKGAWFQRAAYPYLTTITCAGHATISTGAYPHTHGIFQNAWWDRDARKQVSCTEDPLATDLGYGAPETGGDSAHRLRIPTFTDQMRTARAAHVVTLSLKARSAIMPAGHGADAVTWLGESVDSWVTSSVYGAEPAAAVKAFLDANPMSADFGKTWTRLLPAARYTTADNGVGEAPPVGWTRTFPHELKGSAGKADATFLAQWQASPFADEYLGRFAAALVRAFQLGRHEGTDVLAVSFSSPDIVGHGFGPRSQEVQDVYARLDKTIGALFDTLDSAVGPAQWVVALSSDHGVTPIPEQLVAEGKDAGRISSGTVTTALEQVLRPLGEGRHVSLVASNDVYFEPGVYERIRHTPALLESVIGAITSTPGVRKVFLSEEVRGAASSADRLLRAAALSYFPGRSGDLIIAPKPGWMFSVRGTTHGSATADDQRVPILLLGPGIKPGRYAQPATPADIAPTLARLCGITLSSAEGRVLTEAIQ
jgi:predicted AlkP superfamily pyrophosphatase or phosphodiesterase